MNDDRATVLVAVDKFKGSLSAGHVAHALADGIRGVTPDAVVKPMPVADGGEGSMTAALAAGYDLVKRTVTGPAGSPVTVGYARNGTVAVVEVAAASGLQCLPANVKLPMTATSRGTGELIAAAVASGCRQVVLAAGGSACTDGGAGMLQALGAQIVDARSRPIGPGGRALLDATWLDLTPVHELLGDVEIVLAGDVDNPLIGPTGAAHVYGLQKGADAAHRNLLDHALDHWADLLAAVTRCDHRWARGAGAAGGIGFAALAAMHAHRRAGIDVILDLLDFDSELIGADLVITGEGCLDSQSLHGKAPIGVARRARHHNVRIIAVCGRCTLTDAEVHEAGFDAIYELAELEPDPQRSMVAAAELLRIVGAQIVNQHLDDNRQRKAHEWHPRRTR